MRLPMELLLAVGLTASLCVAWIVWRQRANRHDPETRRRETIDRRGRFIEGTVMDYHDGVVVYTWSWRGVDYEASQDCRTLLHRLPVSKNSLIGSVTVKFLPGDPSNSIVISETWSGFRNHRPE